MSIHPTRFAVPIHGGYALPAGDSHNVAARLVLALRSFQLLEDAENA